MKLHNAVLDKPIVSNVGEIGEFRIRNSAKAFNILSSGLYANKIRAIIRELSCNAVDSHVAAGKSDTPFDVHLPNQLEPHFSIRDYGTGLNHEQVKNIYTTYFESTKTNSNEFIGALGLGSKSPFAVTDSFTVESIFDGKKTVYTAFRDEDNFPKLAKLGVTETTERTGVKIQFPVNSNFSVYREEAIRVYKFFKVKPTTNMQLCYDLPEVIISGNKWSLHKDLSDNFAVMGNVAYPVICNAFKADDVAEQKLLSGFSQASGIIFHLDIGELHIAGSRESLEYTKKSKDAIVEILKDIRSNVFEELQQSVDKQIDMYHARLFFVEKYTETKKVLKILSRMVI